MNTPTAEQVFGEWLTIKKPCPTPGGGVHQWILSAFLAALHYGISDERAAEMIGDAMTRDPHRGEIRDAIRKAKLIYVGGDASEAQSKPTWPKRDAAAVASLCTPRMPCSLAELQERSMWHFEENPVDTETIIDHLFPGDPLLCCGWSKTRFDTRTREEWRGQLSKLQFIVPSAMSARKGRKKNPEQGRNPMSAHTEDNTGPRQRLVIEFDTDENGTAIPISEQCTVLWHLDEYLPLEMVVFSAGKSCQGWFGCGNETEAALEQFMRYAVLLGADPRGWLRSQFFRMPGGMRDNGKQQAVHYFSPRATR